MQCIFCVVSNIEVLKIKLRRKNYTNKSPSQKDLKPPPPDPDPWLAYPKAAAQKHSRFYETAPFISYVRYDIIKIRLFNTWRRRSATASK